MTDKKVDPIRATIDDMTTAILNFLTTTEAKELDAVKLHSVTLHMVSAAVERGVYIGSNMKCNSLRDGLVNLGAEAPGGSHVHTDECKLEAQQLLHSAIPGVLDLVDIIADYGHKAYAAGFFQAVNEIQEEFGADEITGDDNV